MQQEDPDRRKLREGGTHRFIGCFHFGGENLAAGRSARNQIILVSAGEI